MPGGNRSEDPADRWGGGRSLAVRVLRPSDRKEAAGNRLRQGLQGYSLSARKPPERSDAESRKGEEAVSYDAADRSGVQDLWKIPKRESSISESYRA